MTPSQAVSDKGVTIYDQGRVTLVGAAEARVIGDTGTYTVRAHKGGGFTCTCPVRGSQCSHVIAASLAWADAASDAAS